MTPRYKVGGVWLDSITTKWSHDAISWGRPEGDVACSWNMDLGKQRPPVIAAGAPVEVFLGPISLWRGNLVAPDYSTAQGDTMLFQANGDSAKAYTVPCLSAAGMTTSRPKLAADQAIARGELNWTDTSALPTAPYRDPNSSPSANADEVSTLNQVGVLLDAWALENQQDWGVHSGVAYMNADPIAPTWFVDPGAGILGNTQAEMASKIYARYLNSATGKLTTAVAGTGSTVAQVDFTGLGAVTATRISGLLAGILRKTGDKVGWTAGFTVTGPQIATGGGVHPHLGIVGAAAATGIMLRAHGQLDPRGLDTGINIIVGTAEWRPADGTLDLNPVNTAGADLGTLVEKVGGVLVQ